MYTGIIDHCGIIMNLDNANSDNANSGLSIEVQTEFESLQAGESIALDGICLTVVDPKLNHFHCDISPETLKCTVAKHYQIGQKVNLERSLRLMDRIGGHIVMGHVDSSARLVAKRKINDFIEYSFADLAQEAKSYFVKKGSVAINGVSLTINEVAEDAFTVMLIPHTIGRTNLGLLRVGALVNIEYDYLARFILNQTSYENSLVTGNYLVDQEKMSN